MCFQHEAYEQKASSENLETSFLFTLLTKFSSKLKSDQTLARFRPTLAPESKSVDACYCLVVDEVVLALSELRGGRNSQSCDDGFFVRRARATTTAHTTVPERTAEGTPPVARFLVV